MPLPEGYLPRKGDVVIAHGTVQHDVDPGESRVYVSFRKHTDTSLNLADVVGLHCRAWSEGDKVEWSGAVGPMTGEVVAVCRTAVWVKSEFGMETVQANDLKPYHEEPKVTDIIEPPPAPTAKEEPDVKF